MRLRHILLGAGSFLVASTALAQDGTRIIVRRSIGGLSIGSAHPGVPTPGSCGSAISSSNSFPPTSGLCAVGPPSGVVTNVNTYTWSCLGYGGASDAICSSVRVAGGVPPVPTLGACGAASGTSVYAAPPQLSACASGSTLSNSVTNASAFSWNCDGTNGGASASCLANRNIDGVCGSSNGSVTSGSAPLTGFCDAGTPSSVVKNGPVYNWSCSGQFSGASASCTTIKNSSVNGVCGSSNATSSKTQPVSGLCSTGAPGVVATSSSTYDWSCAGSKGGINASCFATRTIDGSCGAANGVSTKTPPTTGFCGDGSSPAVSNNASTFDWTCSGSGGGVTRACSAPKPAKGTKVCLGSWSYELRRLASYQLDGTFFNPYPIDQRTRIGINNISHTFGGGNWGFGDPYYGRPSFTITAFDIYGGSGTYSGFCNIPTGGGTDTISCSDNGYIFISGRQYLFSSTIYNSVVNYNVSGTGPSDCS